MEVNITRGEEVKVWKAWLIHVDLKPPQIIAVLGVEAKLEQSSRPLVNEGEELQVGTQNKIHVVEGWN